MRLPAVFVGHGSPMNTLEDNAYTRVWRGLGESLPRPAAVLCISAHWCGAGTAVTAMRTPPTIHDFRGFPQPLLDVRYPASGDPALARRVRALLKPIPVELDQSWGLDHGAWSVLVHMFPNADVPVVQLSLDASLPARGHYELARALGPLRDQGVLVLGSGNVVHNLARAVGGPHAQPFDWAKGFNERVRECVLRGEHDPLIDYEDQGSEARLSVPTPEHYWPLLYVLALARKDESAAIPVDGIELASIGMMTVVVGGL